MPNCPRVALWLLYMKMLMFVVEMGEELVS
jgi:hypothetical protein